jgi:hypothetical protein
VARLDRTIADLAREFILVRQIRMRQVDLDLFDFDYDLTWMGFFLDADNRVLGRYGGRAPDSPDRLMTMTGLRHAMTRALALHRRGKAPAAPVRRTPVRTVEHFPAARGLSEKSCVRCHQVYDLRRRSLQEAKKWTLDEVWVYPLPENLGLTLDIDEADRVVRVAPGSTAHKAGLRANDRLLSIAGRPVASFADVQYALHRAPSSGTLRVVLERGARDVQADLTLAPGWRKTDVSWRWSLRGLDPPPWVQGEDLSVEQKKALGLAPTRLALEQGPFVSELARQAGIHQGDVVIGVDGKVLHLTGRQFAAYIRLEYKVGDRVTYNLLREGKRLDVTLTLRGRVP